MGAPPGGADAAREPVSEVGRAAVVFYFYLLLRRPRWQLYRHQLTHADLRHAVRDTIAFLAVVLLLHTLAMMAFEGMSFGDGLWLTLTTVVTVGYGDYSADTFLGRTATVVLIYFGGIFVMFHVAADYFEYRMEIKQAMLKGRWKWDMKDHVLLLNSPTINPARYFERLVAEIRESREFSDAPVVLVTRDFPGGLPDELKNLGVVHRHGYAGDPKHLEAADAAHAAVVIVLAEQADDKRSDGITFDVLHRLREMGCHARVVAECVADANRDRLRAAGAEIVTRPIRFYPEIMVRAMTSPGAEIILENLFVADDDECVGFKVKVDGRRWADLVMDFMEGDVGTAIAYTSQDGAIHVNPGPNERVHARTVYVIVKQGKAVTLPELQRLCDLEHRRG